MRAYTLMILFGLLNLPGLAVAENPAGDGGGKLGITLQASADGHFGGEVLINDYPMPFLIDTGATITTIPMNLAAAARLPLGQQVETQTAGGRNFAKRTQITSLKLGNAEIRNIDAHINQHLDKVLIGMNTLKYFTLKQTAESMSLFVNEKMLKEGKLDAGVVVGASQSSGGGTAGLAVTPANSQPIRKSSICDAAGKHCITRYGNGAADQ